MLYQPFLYYSMGNQTSATLPDAKFMMMFEYSKIGEAIKKTLSEHQIFYCAIDDFYMGRIDEFKRFVLFHLLKKYLPDIF